MKKLTDYLSVIGVILLQVQTFPMIYYAINNDILVAWQTSVMAIIGIALLTLRQLHDRLLIAANALYITCHSILLACWIT